MNTLLHDLRFALRSQVKSPGFLFVTVVTLALGIGATAAIFTVVNAVVLRPLPYPQPDRLVEVYESAPALGFEWYSVSPANYADWRQQQTVFDAITTYSLYRKTGFNLTSGSRPERLISAGVGEDFFRVLGVEPQIGRVFTAEEDRPGNDRVVVLSHALWQRRYATDPDIIGRTIELDEIQHEVVGVMPADFRYPTRPPVDIWVPLALSAEEQQSRTVRPLFVLARLKPSATLEQAEAEMKVIASRLEQEHPASNTGFSSVVFSMHERTVGNVRPALLMLLTGVTFVLLIACANVANLLLARGATRQRELSLRLALGAGHRRLLRQLVTESVLLSLLGGAAGLLLAVWGVRLLVASAPAYLPRLGEISVDGRVLLFTLAVSLITGILFGLAPYFQAVRGNLSEALSEGGRSGGAGAASNRLRRLLVIAEVAAAVLLLIGAGLMIRSFLALQQVDPGYRTDSVLTLELGLPSNKYDTAARQRAFYREALERLESLPGIDSAALINRLPLSGLPFMWDWFEQGDPPQSLDDVQPAEFRSIDPDYFEVMDIALIDGRALSDQDREDSTGAIIVNRALQRQFFPDQDPVGRQLQVGTLIAEQFPNLPLTGEIVGVVEDVREFQLNVAATPQMYMTYAQYPFETVFLTLRTASDPRGVIASVRNELRSVDPVVPVYNIRTMQERLGDAVSEPRLNMILLGVFAAVALFLASVGVYGVLAYSVNQRQRELGIRLAIGGQPRDVTRLVLAQGMRLVAIGLVLGLLFGVLVSHLLSRLLFEVQTLDPWSFLLAPSVLAAVAVLACLVPALRAGRVDPMVALRSE